MTVSQLLTLTSQAAVRQLGVRVAIVVGAAVLIPGAHLRSFVALSAAAALYTAGEAMLARQKPWAGVLNQWDEAATFGAIAILAASLS